MSEHMQAAVLRGRGQLEVASVPVPTLGPEDVLVAVDWCGVCGTDLHMVLEGWGSPGGWGGHEWTGRVAAVGEGVTGWAEGDAVVGGPSVRCGECRACRAGRPSLCAGLDTPGIRPEHGAFATYTRAGQDELLAVPDGLEPRAAALTEPLAVALHGITRSRVGADQRTLVLGAGPIGALSIAALRALGVDDVTCAEPRERRRALAARVGATAVCHPDDLDVPSIAEPGRIVDGAVDVVLECSGRAAAMEAGLAQLIPGGTLVLVGAGMQSPRFDPNRILLNELVVTGANTYDLGGFERALDLLVAGAMPVDDLIEPEDVGLDGLLDAMHGLADGRLAGKVLVKP
jgi:(R,R)-butanediol dehydrogenase/meso-butanediol dehydrogenase/diacetyl reductase